MGSELKKMGSSQIPPKPALPIRPPNVRVSPLLKAARWSALVLGIMYGARRYKRLEKEEHGFIQPYANKIKSIRDKRLEEERIVREREELENLAREVGIAPK